MYLVIVLCIEFELLIKLIGASTELYRQLPHLVFFYSVDMLEFNGHFIHRFNFIVGMKTIMNRYPRNQKSEPTHCW